MKNILLSFVFLLLCSSLSLAFESTNSPDVNSCEPMTIMDIIGCGTHIVEYQGPVAIESCGFYSQCDFDNNPTVWYNFPSIGTSATIDILSGDNVFYAVFQGSTCPPEIVVLDCNTGSATFDITGGSYYLAVGQETTGDVDFEASIEFHDLPFNYNCDDPDIVTGGSYGGTVACSTSSPGYCEDNSDAVYHSYTNTASSQIDVDFILDASLNIEFSLWSDCNGTPYDDSLPCSDSQYYLSCLPPGETIIIAIAAIDPFGSQNYSLEIIEHVNPVLNNSCDTADEIYFSENCITESAAGTTEGLCDQTFMSDCIPNDWPTVWYSFETLPETNHVSISNMTTGFIYEIYLDDCPVTTSISGCQDTPYSFFAEPETEYFIVVSDPMEEGDFSFQISFEAIGVEVCDGLDNNCDGQIDENLLETYYLDNDADGYGDFSVSFFTCDPPSDYVLDNTDCNDNDPNINPGVMEIPNNNIDENCDGIIANIDADMDGFDSTVDCDDNNASINPGAMEIPDNDVDENCDGVVGCTDNDMDGYCINDDCDDNNAAINPAAMEIPNNNIDENCDGIILIIDADMDGSNSSDDCDDNNPAIFPGNPEVCDGLDNNCNGMIDEGVLMIFYPDNDDDGYGVDAGVISACSMPVGFSTNNLDCDDTNANINPGAMEIPNNNVDENCDGSFDVIDDDMDGYSNSEDCNDDDPNINPSAMEIPDNDIDENCDGILGCTDADNDGYCIDADCNDNDANINPAATEVCDGFDNNCDGTVDEGLLTTYYPDNDGDGYGNPVGALSACTAPAGYVNNPSDCEDSIPDINPGATEIPDNEVDENCDGEVECTDLDMDGYCIDVDCDDLNASINPGATEIPGNGVDEDCDGGPDVFIDEDNDGFGAPGGFGAGDDCDDSNPDINPDATEVCDGVDNNCNGQIDEGLLITYYPDADIDGYGAETGEQTACSAPTGFVENNEDCDDNNSDIYPGALEIPNNDIDEDCDGEDLIIDGIIELGQVQLDIYPNPVPDFMYIESKHELGLQYEVYGVDGKLMMLSSNVGTKIEINLSDLDQGIYILLLRDVEIGASASYRFMKL